MREEWRPVVGYEGSYEVSNTGRVKALAKYHGVIWFEEMIMRPQHDRYGYLVVGLRSHGVQKTIKVHRIVAEAFIPKVDGKPQVNHIDGDKTNNSVENLEWCNYVENIQHAIKTGLRNDQYQSIACVLTDKNTGEELHFSSLKEGSLFLNHKRQYLCKQKKKHGNSFEVGGYIVNV
jgi:hypothetical protein